MPLPNPKSDESKDDYISRFMSWWSDEDSDMDKDQALAAAYDKWDNKSQDDDSGKVARHLVDFIEESAGKVADRWGSVRSQSGQPKEAMLKQAATEETEDVDDELVEKMLNEYPGLMESVAKAIEGGAKDIIIKNRTGTARPRSPMPGIGFGGGGLRGIPDGSGPLARMGMCRAMPLKLEKESGLNEKQAKVVGEDVKSFLKEAEGNFLDKGMNWLKENPRALYGLAGGGLGSLVGGLVGGRGGALAGLGIVGGAGYLGGKQIQNKFAPWLRGLFGGKDSQSGGTYHGGVTRNFFRGNSPSRNLESYRAGLEDGSGQGGGQEPSPPKTEEKPSPSKAEKKPEPEDSRYSDLNITDEEREKIISERQHGRGGVPPHLRSENAPKYDTRPRGGIRIPF